VFALTPPASAVAAAPSVSGAVHAVSRAFAEEGYGSPLLPTVQIHCRRIAPSRFGCSFFNTERGRGGRISVTYSHRHYYVGEPRYEQSSQRPSEPLCGTVYTC
jgi:hypothetical protein